MLAKAAKKAKKPTAPPAVNAQPSSAPPESPSPQPSISRIGHADGDITANTNICRDQSAFTGPDG